MMVLIGLLILVAGFALRVHPLPVIILAAAATGLAAGMDPKAILATFGHAYNENRFVSVIYIVLPLIGLLERHGLQERARGLIATLHGATVGRLLIVYLLFRQITAALGLMSIAGHAQTVRPLVAPMAEGAAEGQASLDDDGRSRIRALAAGTDNIGVFFGEDIFLAVGSILLMKGFLDQYGIVLEPLTLSMWAIPTAICAFAVHSVRLLLLDRRLKTGGRP
jgi:uncharacterized membrane protein